MVTVGHIVVIHDIKMHDIGTGLENIGHFLTQTGKIGGQDGGGKSKVYSYEELALKTKAGAFITPRT